MPDLLLPAEWSAPHGWKTISEDAPHNVQREAPPWQSGVSLAQWLWWDQYRPKQEDLKKWIADSVKQPFSPRRKK